MASFNPFVIFGKKEVKAPEPAPVAEVKEEEEAPEPEISSHTSRYFIVVGSFNNKENALKLKKKLDRKHQVSTTIVEPTGDAMYYRVAVEDFETKEDAINKLEDFKKTYGKSTWVLSY
jgi:cell division protein FtsN